MILKEVLDDRQQDSKLRAVPQTPSDECDRKPKITEQDSCWTFLLFQFEFLYDF